jgi:RES domain-containing protein
MRFQGALYRALNPVFASEPMSGRGAELYGGRFNRKGVPALYLSLSVMTAVREANQAGTLQPTTLVAYNADIERFFDTRDEDALRSEGMDAPSLAEPSWRDQMRLAGQSRTQTFAGRLMVAGYHGLLVRSFAPGATIDDHNIVLWAWGPAAPNRLMLIDDEKRLSR